uniref:Uncharacterized protein n=1 Tax=Arundo donax TaxID=35708 RepID=A0A0A9CMG0_ARUDO
MVSLPLVVDSMMNLELRPVRYPALSRTAFACLNSSPSTRNSAPTASSAIFTRIGKSGNWNPFPFLYNERMCSICSSLSMSFMTSCNVSCWKRFMISAGPWCCCCW